MVMVVAMLPLPLQRLAMVMVVAAAVPLQQQVEQSRGSFLRRSHAHSSSSSSSSRWFRRRAMPSKQQLLQQVQPGAQQGQLALSGPAATQTAAAAQALREHVRRQPLAAAGCL
jgi:hypothetical protein